MTSHHPFVPHQAHEGRGDQKGVDAVHESLKRFESSNNQSAEAVDWEGWEGWEGWMLDFPHVGGAVEMERCHKLTCECIT